MRTIKSLSIPQNTDARFPFSTILNETESNDGTPVVEEIYGDILTNTYKMLEIVGMTPTESQDSDDSQYQIIEALKLLPNSLNDVEQVLSLTSTTWSIPLSIDFLPNKYFFIAKASEDYVSGTSYDFKGTSTTRYQFTSSGFKTSDELLIIIDRSNVRAYSISAFAMTPNEVFSVMGTPLSFNDTNKMWYQDSGQLMSDVPSVSNLESIIRIDLSDGTVLLQDIFVLNGYVLCFCLLPLTNTYFFRQFPISNLSSSSAVTLVGASFSNVSDFSPYVYAQKGIVYVTNNMNTTANNYSVAKLNFTAGFLTFVSSLSLDNTFVKTTNAVIKSGLLYTMISGVLNSFNLTSGVKAYLGNYSGVAGQIFGFNGQVYFSSGEVAKKWF